MRDYRRENPSEEKHARHHALILEICSLSSAYFRLMPRSEMAFTALKPLDDLHSVRQEVARVEGVLELTWPESLLLAAQAHKGEMHPLDFLYRAMGCQVEEVGPEAEEVPFILR